MRVIRTAASRFAFRAASLLTLALFVAIAVLATHMNPTTRGNANSFWLRAVGVDPSGTAAGFGGYGCIDGEVAYYFDGLLPTRLYWLPLSEVERGFPQIKGHFAAEAADPANNSSRAQAYRNWEKQHARWQDIPSLIRYMANEQIESLSQNPELSRSFYAERFAERRLHLITYARRGQHYWANIVFETAFLTGFTWFLLWPLIRQHSDWRVALHVLLAPTLFMLPAWLGYAQPDRDRYAVAGGIVYPWLSMPFMFPAPDHIDWKPDQLILLATPKFLECLNQWPAENAADFLRGSGGKYVFGPTRTLCFGIMFALFAWLLGCAHRPEQNPPGFEVIPPTNQE
jgi:hypothetical protein